MNQELYADLIRQSNQYFQDPTSHNRKPVKTTMDRLKWRAKRRSFHRFENQIIENWWIFYPFLPRELASLRNQSAK